MPAFAILGSTGSTGSEILKILLDRNNIEIRTLVRSESKLELQLAQLARPKPPNLKILHGQVTDTKLLLKCVDGVKAVLITLGPLGNQPGCTIVQDTVTALIDVFRSIRENATDAEVSLPRVVLLSSASLNEEFVRDLPRFVNMLLMMCSHHIYADLVVAEKMLRAEGDWIRSTFVKPGGLVHDRPLGHDLTANREQTFTSYADLAGGVIEVAEEAGEKWDVKDVTVVPKGGTKAKFSWITPVVLGKGLLTYLFPWTYGWIH